MNNDIINTVDISGVLTNSPVTVNQNQGRTLSVADTYIEYVIDESTVHVFSQKPVEKMRKISMVSLLIAGLSVFSDMLGILSYVGVQKGVTMLVLAPICMILALITGKNNWLGLLQVDGDAQFKNGFWYRKLSDGNFISYEKRAKCIYPKCDGWVYIESAPAREKNNHILVGKCSVGGIRHAYTVDYNDIGYPHEFDWGPLEKKSKI